MSAPTSKYRRATTALLRETTLDVLRELLTEREWSAITMADVASAVGVSRQSLYNEFGSRRALSHAYAIRLTGALVSVVETALYEHPGDVTHAFESGFATFFRLAGVDPLIASLHRGKPPEDLLRLITTESDVIIAPASATLAGVLRESWVSLTDHDASAAADAIVRIALSYIATPPDHADATARDLARILTPFVENARERP